MKKKKSKKKPSPTQLPRVRRSGQSRWGEERDLRLTTLGASLQEKRVALGVTQKKLAELSGLKVATISNIEAGALGVKLGTINKYLDTLGLKLVVGEVD